MVLQGLTRSTQPMGSTRHNPDDLVTHIKQIVHFVTGNDDRSPLQL